MRCGIFHFLMTAVEVVASWPGEIVLGRSFQIVVGVGCVVFGHLICIVGFAGDTL